MMVDLVFFFLYDNKQFLFYLTFSSLVLFLFFVDYSYYYYIQFTIFLLTDDDINFFCSLFYYSLKLFHIILLHKKKRK